MIKKYSDPNNDFYGGVDYFLHVQDANPKWVSLLDVQTIKENKGHVFVKLNINEEKYMAEPFQYASDCIMIRVFGKLIR
ncbi:MAG: hypothetical protein ABF976_15425 [Acetobacter syzygii]|uniref:hypothetical protein n=1 Tax=Acetobacter syzygii TaxID=146476 RepID=UPI0039EB0295